MLFPKYNVVSVISAANRPREEGISDGDLLERGLRPKEGSRNKGAEHETRVARIIRSVEICVRRNEDKGRESYAGLRTMQ